MDHRVTPLSPIAASTRGLIRTRVIAQHQQGIYFKVMEAAKLAFDKAGIELPFSHLQLFVDDAEDRVGEEADGLRSAAPRAESST